MDKTTFDVIILIGRPASGKSEIIDFLTHLPDDARRERFHIAWLEIRDDFPMLWTWFEEDALLEEMGHPRLHSDKEGYFLHPYLWDVLIRRICLDYAKLVRDIPTYHQEKTTLIEFSRGSQHGGFQRAFEHLSKQVLERMAVMYIKVSWEESLRKNRARINPDKPDSILEHGLADDKLAVLYKESDWEQVSAGSPTHLTIQGMQVPYAVFENEDDVTTGRGAALGKRLEETLYKLWKRYNVHQAA